MPNCGPLWFFPCIFISGIILWYLLKADKKINQISICIILIASQLICSKYCSIHFPWHIDTAMCGVVFMWLGYQIREYVILDKLNIFICIMLLVTGIYAALSNSTVIDMNNKIIGNPIILYMGASAFSIAVFWFCKQYFKNWHYISYIGKNTDICMAFNFAIIAYVASIWRHIPVIKDLNFSNWIVSSFVIILLCYVIAFCKGKIKTYVA